MYHSYVMPRDRTGDNPHWESAQPHFDDHYCVWDTWRTKFPLMILLDESYVGRVISSFIDRYEHNGKCRPTFTSSLEWDWKQGGDDVDNIIADAFVKGVGGFDKSKAYALLKSDAFQQRSPAYRHYGWEPEPAERMSCSYTMEYAYNDFCVATVAGLMGDSLVKEQLLERQPRNIEGQIIDPNNGKVIEGNYDIGHKPGHEWRNNKIEYEKQGFTRKQVIEAGNNPDNYHLEDPSSNRSHKYEKK